MRSENTGHATGETSELLDVVVHTLAELEERMSMPVT